MVVSTKTHYCDKLYQNKHVSCFLVHLLEMAKSFEMPFDIIISKGVRWVSHSSKYWSTTSTTAGCFLQNSAGLVSSESWKETNKPHTTAK